MLANQEGILVMVWLGSYFRTRKYLKISQVFTLDQSPTSTLEIRKQKLDVSRHM